MSMFASTTSLETGAELLQRRRFGVIVARDNQFVCVKFRPWPKVISIPEIGLLGSLRHRFANKDECRVYYNQPWGHNSFLALRYVESGVGTSLQTVNVALAALDEIARLKGTDALLCDAASMRLSPRVMRRYGWETHKQQRWHRNYIKRFYGVYPELSAQMRSILYRDVESKMHTEATSATPQLRLLDISTLQASECAEEVTTPANVQMEVSLNVASPNESDATFDHFDDIVLTPTLRHHLQNSSSHSMNA